MNIYKQVNQNIKKWYKVANHKNYQFTLIFQCTHYIVWKKKVNVLETTNYFRGRILDLKTQSIITNIFVFVVT